MEGPHPTPIRACPAAVGYGSGCRSHDLTLVLFQLAQNALLLEPRQVVHKDFSFEMVHLMLNADRKQPGCVERKGLAVRILGADADPFGALDFLEDPGHRQTALLTSRRALRCHDFRVDKNLELIVGFGNVDHYDATMIV